MEREVGLAQFGGGRMRKREKRMGQKWIDQGVGEQARLRAAGARDCARRARDLGKQDDTPRVAAGIYDKNKNNRTLPEIVQDNKTFLPAKKRITKHS